MGDHVVNDQRSHTCQHGYNAGWDDRAQCMEETDIAVIAQQTYYHAHQCGQTGIAPEIREFSDALINIKPTTPIVEIVIRDDNGSNGETV